MIQGTLVRHYQYKLPNLAGPMITTPGNLYHYFGFAMADPIIPFRIKDAQPVKGGYHPSTLEQ